MNKKAKMGVGIFLAFLFLWVFMAFFLGWYIPEEKDKAISRGEVCDGKTVLDGAIRYNCCENCEELELEYFKHEYSTSLFGANIENCYCKENNDVKQIW